MTQEEFKHRRRVVMMLIRGANELYEGGQIQDAKLLLGDAMRLLVANKHGRPRAHRLPKYLEDSGHFTRAEANRLRNALKTDSIQSLRVMFNVAMVLLAAVERTIDGRQMLPKIREHSHPQDADRCRCVRARLWLARLTVLLGCRRIAVMHCRIVLERIVGGWSKHVPRARATVLVEQGYLTPLEREAFAWSYSTCSKAVHGQAISWSGAVKAIRYAGRLRKKLQDRMEAAV